ncbi:MAG TPA: SEC-C metal-binding domain-containing protein [Polyangiaceae bacterium]
MPHAHHFLSRLDRLNTREVDTALELYRDPALLRAIMTFAKVPEVQPRVAISLDDPTQGPFIVVTRDGHFVTCLGRGMQASQLPIISRGQLDTYVERVASVRERLALGSYLTGNRERPVFQLMRRMLDRADCLSREEFQAISVWEPILHRLFVDLYFGASREILALTPVLCDIRHFRGQRAEDLLHGYWNIVHVAGHLVLLATMSGDSEYIQSIADEQPDARSALGWGLTQTSMLPFIARAAWAVGRLGKRLLPAYKKALGENVTFFELLDTIFGLVAIGRRNSASRAEISKALHAAPAAARNPHAQRLRQTMGTEVALVCDIARGLIDCDSQELESLLLEVGQKMIGTSNESLTPEALRDVVRVMPLHAYSDGLSDGKKAMRSIGLVAATARDAPERFYLPRALTSQCRRNWEPKHTLLLIEARRQQLRLGRAPARRNNVPERNQPCCCGSGKKYKRCCGSV